MFENVLQILCVQFHLKNVLRMFHQHQLLQQLPKMPLNMYPQNSVRCFHKEIHPYAKNLLNSMKNISDQNREKNPISNKQSNGEIHSYAKPYTTTKPPVKKPSTSNTCTCKSQKYNTICTEISSLMKTYSSGQQEKLEENEKKVLLKSCLNDTTDKIASNILSIECIKRTSFTIYLHIIWIEENIFTLASLWRKNLKIWKKLTGIQLWRSYWLFSQNYLCVCCPSY